MIVTAHPRAAIEAGQVEADALISISGHNGPVPRLPLTWSAKPLLRLVFDDVPAASWQSTDGLWRGPTESDLQAALAFARGLDVDRLAVHCEQGRSRSAGVALAILADQLGAGRESEAVARLSAEWFQPNPLIVALADQLLERAGAIEVALQASCPRYVSWVAYWAALGVLKKETP